MLGLASAITLAAVSGDYGLDYLPELAILTIKFILI